MSHVIIGIHGLSNKPEEKTLAKWWEKAILEGLAKNERIVGAEVNFSSVYWADVMYEKPDDKPDKYRRAKAGALKTYHDGWLDSVRANAFNWGDDILDSAKRSFGWDNTADAVLKHKLSDLSRYYREAKIRNELRSRLRERILQNKDNRIMILAHSMGTIIAYDVLRALGKNHPRLTIDHFVTLGSPLGLPHVKFTSEKENPLVRTPSVVRNWSNFADKRDPVAFDTHLSGDYDANSRGVRVQDDLIYNDWGGINHKSYGYLRAPEVSEVIKNFI